MKSERKTHKPEIQTLNTTNDEKQKENNPIHHFFSSLLERFRKYCEVAELGGGRRFLGRAGLS